ncbi:MAG: hypothetical protein ABSC56_02110 [Solirubrobacteraceae bacterium]
MPRSRQLLVALLAAAALIAALSVTQSAAASRVSHPLVGIADENLAMFNDPRFLSLGIKQVRFYVAWDVLSKAYRDHYRRDILAAWLANAHARGLTPLITFDHSYLRDRAARLPSVAQFSKAFLAFRKRWPWVTDFATWNEANYFGEPTAGDPRRTAQYYLALRRDCSKCTILAAELLDIDNRTEAINEVTWAREFIADAGRQPEYWGLHNYVSANQLSESSTIALLHAVKGYIWLTETGGIVRFPHYGLPRFPLTTSHQATVDGFLLNKLGSLSQRIQRIYLYEWQAVRTRTSWDSALIAADDKPRPAYDVLANTLAAWGIKPDCAISTVPPPCRAAAP